MNRNLSLSAISILCLILTSCFFDITQEIDVNTQPFNNYDNKGNQQLENDSELIIIIPDMQAYTRYEQNHKVLESIIDRIIEMNQLEYKVKAVVQVGDVTDTNTLDEWQTAKTIFSKLDSVNISYVLTTGNHDYGDNGQANSRKTLFNEYFDFTNQSSYIESYLGVNKENSLFEITVQDRPFQILSLEFGPRNAVLKWAKNVLDQDKMSLVVTHAYLNKHQERYDWEQWGTKQGISPYNFGQIYQDFGGIPLNVNDGEDIWQKLIFPSSNIRFVVCGHKSRPDYIGNLISENIENRNVLQMLFNTQSLANGGDGWIQILEFKKNKETVSVKSYSSLYNIWNTEDLFEYDFSLN